MTATKLALFVDTQVDFMLPNGKLYVPEAKSIIGDLNQYAASLSSEEYHATLFTYDTHDADTYFKSAESAMFPIHCEYWTAGHENVINYGVINSFVPIYELKKSVFNMWEENNITIQNKDVRFDFFDREEFFQNLKENNVNTIEVVGVASDYCVKQAIDGLVDRDFKVEVFRNLTAGIDEAIDHVVNNYYSALPVSLKDFA